MGVDSPNLAVEGELDADPERLGLGLPLLYLKRVLERILNERALKRCGLPIRCWPQRRV